MHASIDRIVILRPTSFSYLFSIDPKSWHWNFWWGINKYLMIIIICIIFGNFTLSLLETVIVEICLETDTISHYENKTIKIYWKFYHQKKKKKKEKKKTDKKLWYFSYFCSKHRFGYSLEPPRRGGSNEYPQSMFLSRNKKNNVYPCKPQFYYIKVGFKGVKII